MNHLDLIGTKDVARIIGRSRATVLRMVQAGELTPAGFIGNRKIRVFSRAEIEALARNEGAK
ncbi:helix-turn-helix transcriptional regulator [Corynebacterium poyangense]|nr:helix-turn-helix domain-containing protein [Corynebacterium poyangense]